MAARHVRRLEVTPRWTLRRFGREGKGPALEGKRFSVAYLPPRAGGSHAEARNEVLRACQTLVDARAASVCCHVPARRFASRQEAEDFGRALAETGVTEVLALGGDGPELSPECREASDILEILFATSGARPALQTVGIAAYPEGHAGIDDARLWDALGRKSRLLQDFLAQGAQRVFVATQLSLSAPSLRALRRSLSARQPFLANAEFCVGVFGPVTASRTRALARRLGFGQGLIAQIDELPADALLDRASRDVVRALAPHHETHSLHVSTFDTNVCSADAFWANALREPATTTNNLKSRF